MEIDLKSRIQGVFMMLLGLGVKTITKAEIDINSLVALTEQDWKEVKIMAEIQGVSAIVLDGIITIEDSSGPGHKAERIVKGDWWKSFIIEWIGQMIKIEQANQRQVEIMKDLSSKWQVEGCKVMVFKGQANGAFYPKSDHRTPGDIDCYLFENYNKGNIVAKAEGATVDDSWYKHSVISYKGEVFENHLYFVHTRDGKRGKNLEKELERMLLSKDSQFTIKECVVYPPVQWNAMFLTYHACAHFLSEGLRMKQVLDWAMFLKMHQKDVDWVAFFGFCDKYHLKKFADAITAICVNYLGVRISHKSITIDSQYAEAILESTLYDDDYIYSSNKGSWYKRFYVIKNLFRYKWKYDVIYEESIWRQLWYFFSGFLFHTDKFN